MDTPTRKKVKLGALVSLVLVALFLFTGTVLADGPPPIDGEPPDISDPAVVERLVGELFDVILEGDGTSVWEEWNEQTQDAVVEWVESSVKGEVEVSSGTRPDGTGDSANADSSGCDTHSVSAIAWVTRDDRPVRLYEYKSSTSWCWDGSEITNDPSWTRYPYVYQNFVEFVEHTHSDENGGQGDLTHYDYTRGHYKSCLSWFKLICPFNFYPWIEKQQHYNGETWSRKENG